VCCAVPCCAAATLLEPLADTLREAAGAELKITVRAKGSEQQQVGCPPMSANQTLLLSRPHTDCNQAMHLHRPGHMAPD
jgi:hypothetical protein